MMVSFR
jgi:hypothetical protein